jgi:AraC family transcriptional regulator
MRIKSRSWPGVTVCQLNRPAREMRNTGNAHRINLQLTAVPNATVQVESGRTRQLTVAGLSFVPAGVTVRTMMGAGASIGVLQASAIYEAAATELALPYSTDFAPVWSLTDPVLETLMRLLLDEVDSPFTDDLVADALNRAIAIQMLRGRVGDAARLARAGKLPPALLRRVLDYIESHLGRALTLAELSDTAGLSPFHFSRCFKLSVGISLANFLAQRRIERAKQLLLRSPQPLAEIALAVGFENQASFTARFHRETGISPGRFRKER